MKKNNNSWVMHESTPSATLTQKLNMLGDYTPDRVTSQEYSGISDEELESLNSGRSTKSSSTFTPAKSKNSELNWASDPFNTLLNSIDQSTVSELEGDTYRTVGDTKVALPDIQEAFKDPKVLEMLKFLDTNRSSVEGVGMQEFNTPLNQQLIDLHKKNPSSRKYEPIIDGDGRKNETYATTTNYGAVVGSNTTLHTGLPGLKYVPDQYKDTYMKYSGVLDRYMNFKENFGPSSYDYFSAAFDGMKESLGIKRLISPDGKKDPSIASIFTNPKQIAGFNRISEYQKVDKEKEALGVDGIYDLIPKIEKAQKEGSEVLNTKGVDKLLSDRFESNLKFQDMVKQEMAFRNNKISDYYKEKQAEGKFMYKLPDQIGMSLGMMDESLAITAASLAISSLTKNASPLVTSTVNLANTIATIWSNIGQRDIESKMEFADNRKQRFDLLTKGAFRTLDGKQTSLDGLNDTQLVGYIDDSTDEGLNEKKRLVNAISTSGKLNDRDRSRLVSGLETGMIGSSSAAINKSAIEANNGANEYFKQQMSNSALDMVQDGLALFPVGGGFSKAFRIGDRFLESLSKSRVLRNIFNLGEKAIRLAEKPLIGTGLKTASVLGRMAFNAGLEGIEEGQQYVDGQRFVNGTLDRNNTYVGSLIDGYAAAATGVGASLGIYNKEAYINKDDLRENMWSGVITGGILGAGQGILHAVPEITDKHSALKAKSMVSSIMESRLDTDARIAKSAAYVDASVIGNQDAVMQRLYRLRENPPAGYTKEQVEDEIKSAAEAFSFADNKAVKNFIKKTSSIGSQDHKELVGLIAAHNMDAEKANVLIEEKNAVLTEAREDHSKYGSAINATIDRINESLPEDKQLTKVQRQSLIESIIAHKAVESLSNRGQEDLAKIKAGQKVGEAKEFDPFDVNARNRFEQDSQFAEVYNAALSQRLAALAGIMHGNIDRINNGVSTEQAILNNGAINGIELTDIDKTHLGARATVEAANAGRAYDLAVVHNLLGETTSGEKMKEASHIAYASNKLQKYREGRSGEAKIEEEKVVKAEERAKENLVTPPTTDAILQPTEVNSFDDFNGKGRTEPIRTQSTAETETPIQPKEVEEVPIAPVNEVVPEVTEPKSFNLYADEEEGGSVYPVTVQIPNEETGDFETVEIGVDLALSAEEDAAAEAEFKAAQDKLADAPTESSESVIEETTEAIESGLVEDVLADESSNALNNLEESGIQILPTENRHDPISRTLFTSVQGDFYAQYDEFCRNGIEQELASGTTIEMEFTRENSLKIHQVMSDQELILAQLKKSTVFDPTNPKSYEDLWSNIGVSVRITRNGKTGTVSLRTPATAIERRNKSSVSYSNDDLAKLVKVRDSILNAKVESIVSDNQKGNKTVLIPVLSIGKGLIDVNRNDAGLSEQRSLDKIVGIPMPMKNGKIDYNKIDTHTVPIAFGTGEKGKYTIETIWGQVLSETSEESSNTGNVFIAMENPYNKRIIPLKVNPVNFKRFADKQVEGGSKDSVVDLLANVLLFSAGNNNEILAEKTGNNEVLLNNQKPTTRTFSTGITNRQLLNALLYHNTEYVGKDGEAIAKDFLMPKHVKIEDNKLYLGNSIAINLYAPTEGDLKIVKEYLANNINFSVSKYTLVDMKGEDRVDNKVADVFPGLRSAFEYAFQGKANQKITLANGLEVEESDLDLTWLGFMIKKGLITSDAKDKIFTTPFTYIEDVKKQVNNTPIVVPTEGGGLAAVSGTQIQTEANVSTGTIESL
jgi:hypothetical protein